MEIEKKYFTKHQLLVLSKMEKGVWYCAYDLKLPHAIMALHGLFRKEVVDMKELSISRARFHSNNLHYLYKVKDEFKMVENQPSSWRKNPGKNQRFK